jgi:SAM-dependent methyltransferase
LTSTEERTDLKGAQHRLAREWLTADPQTPDEILNFYRDADGVEADLQAWHSLPWRQRWTTIVTHVAQQIDAKSALDIGCGAGFELRALRDTGRPIALAGVEPNRICRANLRADGFRIVESVANADLTTPDLFICMDMLEHVVDPEAFLGHIASSARVGAVMVESTATFDCDTPLHLKANRGWHPGRCMETHGWELLDERGRVRVWQRRYREAPPRAGALICAYRSLSVPTHASVLKLEASGWDVPPIKYGDGYIPRARGIIVSKWYRQTADDVFLMIDDDIVFEPNDANRLVELCRKGHDIICAAYPIRDGAHLAIAVNDPKDIHFHPDEPPKQIRYAATGFMAVHRRVIDALIKTLPLCHANQDWAYWPMFGGMVIEERDPVEHVDLSEDWAFCQRATDLGFKIWLDPGIRLGHLATMEIDVMNMKTVSQAHQQRRRGLGLEPDDDEADMLDG